MTSPASRVTVVVPALDEEASIAAVVRGFRAEPAVELVIVVDNGSRDRTAERARQAGAVVVAEPRRGYGAALRTGIEHALGAGAERVALAEADGTFEPSELALLLEPLGTYALVLGSRTGAMSGAMRFGNRAVARVLAALWPRSSCPLTDVGCTFRVFTAEAWRALRDGTAADGPEFSPQMMCEAFRSGLAVCEIGVSYRTRASGESKHTGGIVATLRTATRMLRAIVAKRCERASRAR